jgi:hypothetical protein
MQQSIVFTGRETEKAPQRCFGGDTWIPERIVESVIRISFLHPTSDNGLYGAQGRYE